MKNFAPLAIAIAMLSFALQGSLSFALEADRLSAQELIAAPHEGAVPGEEVPYDSQEEQPDLSAAEPSSFPIEISFKLPRTYGFHLGDEIKLVMVINARPDTVVDLVNLPRKGEGHGPFEIKDFKIKSKRTKNAISYRVDYLLQSFMPIFAVEKLVFPPLEILYADGREGDTSGSALNYRSLVSQPLPISYSRTATYIGPMKDVKGALDSGWGPFIFSSIFLGFLVTGFSLALMAKHYIGKRQIGSEQRELTPYERAVQEFNAAQEAYYVKGGNAQELFSRISKAFRNFLTDTCGVNATSKSAARLEDSFKGDPSQGEIIQLLASCEDVVYGGFDPSPIDVDRALRQYLRMIDKIDGRPNGNGRPAQARSQEDRGQDRVSG